MKPETYQEKLAVAEKALQFYADQKHYDVVEGGNILGADVRVTRLLDNGAVAQEALIILNPSCGTAWCDCEEPTSPGIVLHDRLARCTTCHKVIDLKTKKGTPS